MTRKTMNLALRLLVGISILSVLAWKIGPQSLLTNLAGFKISALILLNVSSLAGFMLAALGILVLGRSISRRLEWIAGIRNFLATISLSLFIPGRAGDLALLYYWKDFLSSRESLAIVLTDKVITLFWVVMLGLLGVRTIFGNRVVLYACALGAAMLIALLLLISVSAIRSFFSAMLPDRFLNYVSGTAEALRLLMGKRRGPMLISLLLTGLRMFCYGLGFWISLWGLGIQLSLLYAIFVMSIAQFTSILPISVMGLGTVEAISIYCLNQVNIDPSITISALLVGRFVSLLWLGIFFTLFCLPGKKNMEHSMISSLSQTNISTPPDNSDT